MILRITLLLLLVHQQLFAEQTLCQRDEKVLFSCHNGSKVLSLCQTTARPTLLRYRFGTEEQVELDYPGKQVVSEFYTESFPLYGGGVTYVGFSNGQYEYKIYSKNTRAGSDSDGEERMPITEDGVLVLRNGKQIRQLVCDDGGEGFRDSLDFLPLRK